MFAQQSSQFCYLIINNEIQLIIISTLLCLSVLIVGDAIRKFWKMRGSHNADVTVVYILLFVWWITYVSHHAINITVFLISSNLSDSTMSQISSYNFIVNWLNTFVIQWILLYVPYHWSKQIIYLFTEIQNNMQRQSQITGSQSSQYSGPEGKIFKLIKAYNYIRLLFIASCVIFLVENSYPLIIVMVCLLLFDCIVIGIALFLGMYSLKYNQKLIEQLDNQQITKMFNQYLMILLANFFRLFLDTSLVFKSTRHNQFFIPSCAVDQTVDQGQIIQSVLLCLFAHYLPVIIILRIYHLQDKPEEMGRSLLITTSQNNGQE